MEFRLLSAKKCAIELAVPLLKRAAIVPIYKSGDKSLRSNYRPISLTPILMKIFERIIRKQVTQFLTETKCKVLHMGNSNPNHCYTMSNIPLTRTAEEKDLGVIMDNELNFHKHTYSICGQESLQDAWTIIHMSG